MSKERVISFGSPSLSGILTQPDEGAPQSEVGMLLLNPGMLTRIGPQRIHVRLAREAAAIGVTSLRFDFSGVGESPPRSDNLDTERYAIEETAAAIEALKQAGCSRILVAGLCSGAEVALRIVLEDPSVAEAVLINPRLIDVEIATMEFAKAHKDLERRHLMRRMLEFDAWMRLILRKGNPNRMQAFAPAAVEDVADQAGMGSSSNKREGEPLALDPAPAMQRGQKVKVVLSDLDPHALLYRRMVVPHLRSLGLRSKITRLRRADHVMTLRKHQNQVAEVFRKELRALHEG